MKQLINKQIELLKVKFKPQINNLTNKWNQLQDRERILVGLMVASLVCSLLYISVDSIVKYKASLQREVVSLNEFVLYANQASVEFKNLSKLEAKSSMPPSVAQVESDVIQITSIEHPSVNLQDGQLAINIPEVQFNQVMMLLDQLRRSYGLFPDQLTIARKDKDGIVSLSALFWVN